LIDHLREVAEARDDIRIECAGTIARSWIASGVRRGEELIAAGPEILEVWLLEQRMKTERLASQRLARATWL
jgi:hypothetical protein